MLSAKIAVLEYEKPREDLLFSFECCDEIRKLSSEEIYELLTCYFLLNVVKSFAVAITVSTSTAILAIFF